MALFTIDGREFDVAVPAGSLKRQARVTDGDNVGRSKSGEMIRDIIGTFYNYSLTFDTRGLSRDAYNQLYEILTSPVDYHNVTFPYGASEIQFKAYVTNVDDVLISGWDSINVWGDMTVNFIAMAPQRRPS